VRLTTKWMPHAQFDHARHSEEKCTSCHQDATESDSSNDILLPRIARCRECHGGVAAAAKVSSDCVMCHTFHTPNRERWEQLAPVDVTAQPDPR
jgi:hypothetical protein